jgi:hypothetical protein
MKSVIYANISENHKVATGYLDWFKAQYKFVATDMLSKQLDPDTLLKVINELENKKFKFANRIRKSHHVNIPADIIYMKLKGFIREVANDVIKQQQAPEQLEFDFGEEK